MRDWRQMLCLSSGSASFEGESFRDLVNRVNQMLYPYVRNPAAQACESDDLRHPMSPVSHFLSSFSGAQRILGYVKDRSGASSRNREKKEHLEEPSDWDSLHVALWRNWPLNAPPNNADLNWGTASGSAATAPCDVGSWKQPKHSVLTVKKVFICNLK